MAAVYPVPDNTLCFYCGKLATDANDTTYFCSHHVHMWDDLWERSFNYGRGWAELIMLAMVAEDNSAH